MPPADAHGLAGTPRSRLLHRIGSLLIRRPLLWAAVRESAVTWQQHEAMRRSAALAFYSVLSLAPLLTISLMGLIGQTSAQQQVIAQFGTLLGPQGASAVRTILRDAQQLQASSIASAIGLVTLWFSASQVFAELQEALDKVWEADRSRTSGWRAYIRERFLSFGLVLSCCLR